MGKVDLSIELCGVELKNPVIPASGTYEFGKEYLRFLNPEKLGAVINKTVTLKPRVGNPLPRICETPCGLINAIGIPSPGIDAFIEKELPLLKGFNTRLVVSIAGFSVEEFCTLANRLGNEGGIDFVELNLSCPNLEHDTIWATDEKLVFEVIKAVKEVTDIPIMAKLANIHNIGDVAIAAERAGANALVIANTYRAMKIDIHTKRPYLGNISGGLSGPAVLPMTLFAVYNVYERVSIPVVAVGGISDWRDVVEYILAGATAVEVGSANLVNPSVMDSIIDDLGKYLEEESVSRIDELIGLAHRV